MIDYSVTNLGLETDTLVNITADTGRSITSNDARILQKIVMLIMTEKGDDPLNSDFGTDFMLYFNSGVFNTSYDMLSFFSIVALDIVDYINEDYGEDILGKIQIYDVTYTDTSVMLYLKVFYTDGTQIKLSLGI